MKKTIIAAGVALGLGAFIGSAAASEFLYGACKPFRDTEFYRCLSADEQLVYTNQLPSDEIQKKWRKAYAERQRARLAAKLAAKKRELRPETPKEEPDAVALKEAEECAKKHAEVKRLMDRWSQIALTPHEPGTTMREKEMDVLEYQIGTRIADLCSNASTR